MAQIEKIKAEIERIKKLIDDNRFLSEFEKGCNQGREDVCDDLIDFINSLQAEPVSEDFTKELQDFVFPLFKMGTLHSELWDKICKIAHHFANWQREQMLKDAIPGYLRELYKSIDGEMLATVTSKYAFPYKKHGLTFEDKDKIKLIILKED